MHAAIPLGAFGFCTTQPQYSCKMAERELSVHAVHKSEVCGAAIAATATAAAAATTAT